MLPNTVPPAAIHTEDDSSSNPKEEAIATSSTAAPPVRVNSPKTGPFTLHDVFNAKPPSFKERIQAFFYHKGLADMPQFMHLLYEKTPRQVYVNYDLPDDMRSPHSEYPLMKYPRNKIRTTKYTPLSFFPKNIFFQFTNVANSYFLFLIILGAFQVFGVQSPGLAAVPLIVIVIITAVKDAFEDYRRGASDNDLNNSPIHLLAGLHNTNAQTENVGGWRRFKKACTRATNKTLRGIKKAYIFTFAKKAQKDQLVREEAAEENLALRRVSTVISDTSLGVRPSFNYARNSVLSPVNRRSLASATRPAPSKPLPNTLLNPAIANTRTEATRFKNRRWKDISVGDFIRVRSNEEVPADMVIISTSDVEGNCYIETKNLDGETNLKGKTSLKSGGAGNLKHANDLGSAKFWIECDPPNGLLYSFKGTLHYEHYDANSNLVNADEKEALTADNILLRGSTLRNTKWVIGVVVYTGDETKIMINSGTTPTKKSQISKDINLSVIINFIVLFVLCFISGVVNGVFYTKSETSRIYFDMQPYGNSDAARGVIAFFVSLIIYQALVPISLYISVEIIKTLQAFFIFSDIKMYYERLDFPCVPKSWNISDDLGQIEYVFSDKTGTLTQNVMEFKKCTIGGVSYGLAYTEAKQGLDKRDGKDPVVEREIWKKKIDKDRKDMLQNLTSNIDNDQLRPEAVTFCSNDFVVDTIVPESSEKNHKRKEANETFMLTLALCHTVVTEQSDKDATLRDLKAESPDEAALVAVARDVGIVFKERLRKSVIVNVYGKDKEYEILQTIPFTSARKRMSQIVQTPEKRIYLLTKGADNVIFQRLASDNDHDTVSKTAIHLEDYANEGLRTLCIAQKELDESFVQDWLLRYKNAQESIKDDRDILIEQLDEELERDLHLLGGTAIEDRLQDGVPESISLLADAGIKLWVLTGDRIETAINIGFSCNLLENKMKLLVVRPNDDQDGADVSDFDAYLEDLIGKHIKENFGYDIDSDEELEKLIEEAKNDHSTPSSKYALIIDGAALSRVFNKEKLIGTNGESKVAKDSKDSKASTSLQKKFLLLGKNCKSVLCCRVSPAQKADVVKIVRDSLSVMALAIGDGANDVAMIQAANVGVGIAGEEGRQAVMSSDYAIGQFRFLTRLLLVHGRWSYKRLAEMIPCFFYKNVAFTITCFWYGIFNNFDGSYLYEYTFLMFYNLAFTSLPVIFLAVLDQDVSDTVSVLVPQLYRRGILRKDWSQYKFTWYMLDGLYQSVISFFFPYLIYYKSFQNEQGLAVDHRFWIGVVATCVSVTSVDFYVILRQYRWDWLSILILAISVLLVYFWTGVWSATLTSIEFYKAGAQVFGTLACWCCIFIGVLVCVLPRFVFDFLKRNFRPTDVDIIREQVRRGDFAHYPISYDPTNKEDVERFRLESDPEFSKKKGVNGDEVYEEKADEEEKLNPITRTFRSVRRATLSRSRKSSSNLQPPKPPHRHSNLDDLRKKMIEDGEYGLGGAPLNRINTSHDLPGLSQANTLLSYHARNSSQLERV